MSHATQLDIFGLPVATRRQGACQGILIDEPATLAQVRAQSRLHKALALFVEGTTIMFDVDLQAWTLPPLSPTELQDAAGQVRGLRRCLQELEMLIDEAMEQDDAASEVN